MAKRAKAVKAIRKGPQPGQKPVIRGDRLRALRLAKGWTLAELAYRSAVSAQQINAVEAGRRDVQVRGFRALCIALACDPAFLLGLDEV